MKKKAFLISTIALGLLLVGCGNQKQNIQPAKNDSSRTSAVSSSATSSSTKNDNNQAKSSSTLSSNTNQTASIKTNQVKSQKVNQKFNDGKLIYTINEARLFNNQAKNSQQLDAAKRSFNVNKLPNNYKTILLNITITNRSNSSVILNGLNYMKIANNTVTSAAGLNDGTAGKLIPGNKSKTANIVGLASSTPKKITIEFQKAYNQLGKKISSGSKIFTIKLN